MDLIRIGKPAVEALHRTAAKSPEAKVRAQEIIRKIEWPALDSIKDYQEIEDARLSDLFPNHRFFEKEEKCICRATGAHRKYILVKKYSERPAGYRYVSHNPFFVGFDPALVNDMIQAESIVLKDLDGVKKFCEALGVLRIYDLAAPYDRKEPNWQVRLLPGWQVKPAAVMKRVALLIQCDRKLYERVKNLDEGKLRQTLKPFLRGYEIDALLKRRKKLVEHFEGLIREKGENRVLFNWDPGA